MRIVSGIQPSGIIHLGNYLGAIKQQIELQSQFDEVFYFIADLHAITGNYNPQDLRKNTLSIVATYLACGLDPQKSNLFLQSFLPEHSEMAWLILTQSTTGELSRMTQFKDKSRGAESVPAGIFAYPALMAGDILLYRAGIVPVGEDQVQHIELTRDLAKKFNKKFGDVLVVPEARIVKDTKRIMALNDPTKKMSKSAESALSYIALTDSADDIRNKIKRAVTDSGSEITYDNERPALKNLLDIFSGVTGRKPEDIAKDFTGKSYADFKGALADAVVEFLAPIQERYFELLKDEQGLVEVLENGAQRARPVAQEALQDVKRAMGFLGHKTENSK